MSTQVGMTIRKRFSYRGDATEEYSNTYWLSGTVPADSTGWRTLFDALVTAEKVCYPSNVAVIGGYGYDNNDGHKSGDDPPASPAVWSVDLRVSPETVVAGTLSPGGTWAQAPGDAAVWLRIKTDRMARGKPVYLRKYFHPAIVNTAASPDTINAAQATNLTAFATALKTGIGASSRTLQAAGHADALLAVGASAFVTTRTLKRRSKRNPA